MERQIRYFEMQHERNPRARHFIALADLKRRNGKYGQAVELLRGGLARCPESVSARWLLGLCLLAQESFPESAEQLELVLQQDPDHHLAPEALARCRRGDVSAADDGAPETGDEQTEPWAEFDEQAERLEQDVGPGETEDTPPPGPEPAPETPAEAEAVPSAQPDAKVPAAIEPASPVIVDASPADPPALAVESGAEAGEGPDAEAVPSMFVTRTLADIYLAQGHKDKALRILYQVLEAHPEREDIVARITALEAAVDASAAGEAGAEGGDAAAEDLNRHRFDAWVTEQDREG
ncbi:tetratricopeptide repeat protein [bacterium]|nr:tetratricopeptide repeat protein [bacterium]